MRDDFPIQLNPGVDFDDFYLTCPESTISAKHQLPNWFRRWLVTDNIKECVEELAKTYNCNLIERFTHQLFTSARVVGTLVARKTTKRESRSQWLVIEKRGYPCPQSLCVKDLLQAPFGQFVFIGEPAILLDNEFVKSNVVYRFFSVYGGLRGSPPFFGGDFFATFPSEIPQRMLTARPTYQSAWKASSIVHTWGNCDYWVLSPRGEVGYIPIEPERKIEVLADCFSDSLDIWLSRLDS